MRRFRSFFKKTGVLNRNLRSLQFEAIEGPRFKK